VKKRDLKFPKV